MQRQESTLVSKVSTVLVVAVLIYVFFLLYQSVYTNWQTSKRIKNLKLDLVELERDKLRLESLIAYYKTNSFQELEARKKLGFKMPNEKVITVKVEEEQEKQEKVLDQTKNEPPVQIKSNFEKWLDYFKGSEV